MTRCNHWLVAILGIWLGCGGDSGDARDRRANLDRYVPTPARDARSLEVAAIERIDMLFIADDSGSMKQEHEALRMQFPRIVRALVTGDIDADGEPEFAGVSDLHLGVISPDLGGLGTVGIERCEGGGDDALLQHEPQADGCAASYPSFLTYVAADNDVDRLAADFACVATLGTDGCGFEQPLEAALKALWPDGDARVDFFMLGEARSGGHGDGANAGFSRGDADGNAAPSLLIVVLLTDEDDCSAWDGGIFTPTHFLPPDDPRGQQALNLRCFLNADGLYPVERYVEGLRLLREGAEQLVMFTLIAGVPAELVTTDQLDAFDYDDPVARDAFYDVLLEDPRMQEEVDETRTPEQGANLTPSCDTGGVIAYPPRRLVQVARGFGANGIVQSLCQADYGEAVGRILERIAHRMQNPMAAPE